MTTATPTQALPHWDMTVIYPNLDSPQFEKGFAAAVAHIADLAALFDAHAVGARDRQPLDEATVRAFDTVIARYNDVLKEIGTLGAYISSFVSTNSRDDHAQSLLSTMQRHTVLLAQLDTRLTAWIGSLDVDALLARSETARAHAYTLQRAQVEAAHQMSPDEEALAAELEVTGGTAWGKLHGNWTSQLSVPVELDGATQELPMSRVRVSSQRAGVGESAFQEAPSERGVAPWATRLARLGNW